MRKISLTSSLSILALCLLMVGCENFTLINSVNLGGDASQIGADAEETEEQNEGDKAEPGINNPDICWPSAAAAVAEMRTHGYSPKAWPKTAAWLDALFPVKRQHPPCPQ